MVTDWTEIYKKYRGLWVALKDDEKTVISSGIKLDEAAKKAKENIELKEYNFKLT